MKATLTLYKGNEYLRSDKLFMIDDISEYLSSLNETPVVLNNFQYQKPELELDIKLILDEEHVWPLKLNDFKYLSLLNTDASTPIYYFIQKIEWTSQSACRLKLLMDVLNTFRIGTDYTFNAKTLIERQHKDRLSRTLLGYHRYYTETEITPISTIENDKYYLLNVLPTRRTGYTYDRYDFTENGVATDINVYTFTKDSDNHITLKDKYNRIRYFEIDEDNTTFTLYDTEGGYTYTGTFADVEDVNFFVVIRIRNTEPFDIIQNSLEYAGAEAYLVSHSVPYYRQNRLIDLYSEGLSPVLYHNTNTDFDIVVDGIAEQDWYLLLFSEGEGYPVKVFAIPENAISVSGTTMASITAIDRSDSKIIKIIMLPYAPFTYRYNTEGTEIIISSAGWTSTTETIGGISCNVIKYTYAYKPSALEMDLTGKISTIYNPINTILNMDSYTFTKGSNRNDIFESKLYHSDFFYSKVFYDSYSFIYKFENIDWETYYSTYTYITNRLTQFRLKYYVSLTMQSNFAFRFYDYDCDKRAEDDYYQWLIINRNNEVAIFNNDYINYIRAGYNYDRKNKNASTTLSWLGTGLQTAGTIASWVSAAQTGGLSVPLAIGMTTTTIVGISNSINTTIQNERSMEEKLAQLKIQATSVSGSDDVDLLRVYSNNRLRYCEYKVSDIMKNLLADLFYYTGYKDNTMAVPDTASRLYFNYLQCKPVLDYTCNISKECREQLETIMQHGFTRIHKVASAWDMAQTKENFERDLNL